MKKILSLIALGVFTTLTVAAQSVETAGSSEVTTTDVATTAVESRALTLPIHIGNTPLSFMGGYGLWGMSPWAGGWGNTWALHDGFNAQVGLNVTAAFGKNAPSGVGFGQNLAVAYAHQLTPRFSFAVGLYGSNLDWGRYDQREMGVAAVVKYKANEWLDLYAYGSKNLASKHELPLLNPLYAPFQNPDARVGAAAEFKLGSRASIGICLDWVKYDDQFALPVAKHPRYEKQM